jgi:hypothetical protein
MSDQGDVTMGELMAAFDMSDLLLAHRMTEATGPYGATATITERARLVRFHEVVMLTIPAVEPLRGSGQVLVASDEETAAVDFANLADALRRDGWTVRDPEPWEIPDPLAVTTEAPF